MTILPIFKPSARIRERSPFDVGCASRMDLARVAWPLAAGIADAAFFVLAFDGVEFTPSPVSSSSASTMTFLGTPTPADGGDFSATGITLVVDAVSRATFATAAFAPDLVPDSCDPL